MMKRSMFSRIFMGRCLMLLLLTLTSIAASGQEAYAVFTEADSTLTFYCDSLRSTRTGTSYLVNAQDTVPEWRENSEKVYHVVFDTTFVDARPTSTRCWFCNMNNLDSITGINYLNTDSVTDMGYMFDSCWNLTSLDLSSFNTAKVTNMEVMFAGCKSLTTLDLRKFNTANVTNMEGMFAACDHLETIYAGNDWSTDSVTNSESMFYGCINLAGDHGTVYDENHVDAAYAHLDGGPADPGYLSVWKEAYACCTQDYKTLTFYCDSLRSSRSGTSYLLNTGVTNPGWHAAAGSITKVVFDSTFVAARPTTTYAWFYQMNKLDTIVGITYLNTSKVTDMRRMFSGCSLPTLDLSGFNTSNVTTMWAMFADCDSLTTLDLSGFNTSNVTNMARMFADCDSLISVNLNGFNTSNVIDMAGMFASCDTLITLDLRSFNTDSVKYMGWMFDGCKKMASLDVSSFNTSNVTEMEYMFQGCESLASLDLSGFNTANVTGMEYMFASCKLLESPDLSGFNTSKVTDMAGLFAGCKTIASLDLSGFNTAKVVGMEYMFQGCESLSSLDLSSFNTAKVRGMKAMFKGCNDLETIYASDGWRTGAVTESSEMFSGCTHLVGGQGTVYDENHVDAARAHIDGGPSNPGYLTGKVYILPGDVNADGEVNIADVNCIISVILGDPDNYEGRADVNGDGEVTIADINAIFAYIF